MSRVIIFSRHFPSYHSRAGEPTYFVEKFWKSLGGVSTQYTDPFIGEDYKKSIVWGYQLVEGCKYHTIRSSNRWKVGDKFSPRVWSGKAYKSKMITIAPDIEIKKVWDFEIRGGVFFINNEFMGYNYTIDLAENDGLDLQDMLDWFRYPNEFTGQIITWNDKIDY